MTDGLNFPPIGKSKWTSLAWSHIFLWNLNHCGSFSHPSVWLSHFMVYFSIMSVHVFNKFFTLMINDVSSSHVIWCRYCHLWLSHILGNYIAMWIQHPFHTLFYATYEVSISYEQCSDHKFHLVVMYIIPNKYKLFMTI